MYILRKIMVVCITCSLISLWCPMLAQVRADDVTSRRIDATNNAAGKQLIINQVDTSQFPKVNIFATVLDNGSPVLNLTSSDFRVREDEVDQEPITVVPHLTPLSVVVTLDCSGSMAKAMSRVKEAAKSFFDALDPADQVSTISFARTVNTLSKWSSDKASAKSGIDSTVARGDTALYDALFGSVEALKDRPGRKAVVLLSDGVDDDGTGKQLSHHSVDEVLALAKDVNVPIYAIGLGTQIDRALLNRISTATGALAYDAPAADELKKLYQSIGQQLSGQYNILYSSNLPGDASTHRIQLLHGELRGVKEYLSPNTGAPSIAEPKKVEAAPTLAASPTSEAGGPTEIKGGADFNSAVPIQADRLYKQKDAPQGGQHYVLQSSSGNYLTFHGQRLSQGPNLLFNLYNSSKQEINKTYCYETWCTIDVKYLVPSESDGRLYLVVDFKGDSVFGVFAQPAHDANSSGDAGGSEAKALGIETDKVYTGYLSTQADKIDYYRLSLPVGQFKVKVRPFAECAVSAYANDENGVDLSHSWSQNKGAGFVLDLKVKTAGAFSIKFTTDFNGLCLYSFIVGPETVAAPIQPQPLETPAVSNLRPS